jgi:Domain of unknown function (DUF4349)
MSSADVTGQLRATRPLAPEALRERVRAIAAAPPVPSSFPRVSVPHLRLAIPALAATALAAAGLIAVVRPQHQETSVVTAKPPTTRSAVTHANPPASTVPVFGAATDQAQQAQALAPATKQAPSVGAAPAPTTGRAVDYQAQIGVRVKDSEALSSATARAQAIARDLGGYVVSVEYASADTGNASLTLRVPTAKVQAAIAQLTALGTITSQQVQIQDLQDQLDRLARRIAVLRGRIAHITVLLANPDLTAERRAQLEADRTQLQNDLRSVRAQKAATSNRAALATIQLTLTTSERSITPVPASRIHRTLDKAGRIITWEGIALLYGLVVVAPLALVGMLGWFAARQRRRSIEARLLARSS